ncbi:MAG TPA: hypothetical protein VER79_13675, partial [Candidatus Limnocylindrales bacterium]|nr:hypothetical protein [Candidatus Limnocylindrales bacterium]
MKRISCWILAGALLVVVIPNILVLSQAESEQRQGMIAFVSDRFAPFRYEIYGMNPDGSSQRMLTESMGMGASSTDFAWSPDGAQMAFVSDLGASDSNIWVMNADGSNP